MRHGQQKPGLGDIYEVVVATSAMICKKGLLPTPELALFRRLCRRRLEAERLCKFVSLVMFVPREHYISGALQAQFSSAYSSSTDEG